MNSWIKALANDPKELRAAAVDAQRISDWTLARERSQGDDQAEHEQAEGGTREISERDPERSPRATPEVGNVSQATHDATLRDLGRSPQVAKPPGVGDGRWYITPSR